MTDFASKATLEQRRSKRRFKEFEWGDIGTVVLQSAMASEWIKIDAARQRARIAAASGNKRDSEIATQDFLLGVCLCLVLDGEHNPFFVPSDKELILSLDASLTDQLVTAAMEHCGDASVGDAQKN